MYVAEKAPKLRLLLLKKQYQQLLFTGKMPNGTSNHHTILKAFNNLIVEQGFKIVVSYHCCALIVLTVLTVRILLIVVLIIVYFCRLLVTKPHHKSQASAQQPI
jgi:hypothetical protein